MKAGKTLAASSCSMRDSSPVMRGLDRAFHLFEEFFEGDDCRVKPGNDSYCLPRHMRLTTASHFPVLLRQQSV